MDSFIDPLPKDIKPVILPPPPRPEVTDAETMTVEVNEPVGKATPVALVQSKTLVSQR